MRLIYKLRHAAALGMSQGSGEVKASRQSHSVNGNDDNGAAEGMSKGQDAADVPQHGHKRRKLGSKAKVPDGIVSGSKDVSACAQRGASAVAAVESPASDSTAPTAMCRCDKAA